MKKYWWIILLLAVALTATLLLLPEQTVLMAGDISLDSTDFSYYYWSEFFYFKEAYGTYLAGAVDFSKPLDRQLYDDGITWQDYLVSETVEVAADTLALVMAAQREGFVLPADYEESLKQTWNNFLTQSGGNLNAYLRDSYGRGAHADSFYTYLEHCHLASAYADQLYNSLNPSMAEIRAYRDDHMGEYLDAGLTGDADLLQQAMEDLLAQQHGEQVRQLRAAANIQIDKNAIRIRAPKGLYE